MEEFLQSPDKPYFPALVCHEFDSPIDALVSLCVPLDEATELVAASWVAMPSGADCVVARIDGGRTVAALRTEQGRWAACNAFLEHCCATSAEAERRLRLLQKRGRSGRVGCLAG